MIPNRILRTTSFQSPLLKMPCNISKRSPSPDTMTMSVHFFANSSSPHTRSLAWLRLVVTTTSYRIEDCSRRGATVLSKIERAFPGPLLGFISISNRRSLQERETRQILSLSSQPFDQNFKTYSFGPPHCSIWCLILLHQLVALRESPVPNKWLSSLILVTEREFLI